MSKPEPRIDKDGVPWCDKEQNRKCAMVESPECLLNRVRVAQLVSMSCLCEPQVQLDEAERERLAALVEKLRRDLKWCNKTAWNDNEGCYVVDVATRLETMLKYTEAAAQQENDNGDDAERERLRTALDILDVGYKAMQERAEAAEALVEELPLTEDGVRMVPKGHYFAWCRDQCASDDSDWALFEVIWWQGGGEDCFNPEYSFANPEENTEYWEFFEVGTVHSTRDAAAQKENDNERA